MMAPAQADGHETLVDDAALRITRKPGSGRGAVVSFSGIGLKKLGGLDEVQTEEFGRSTGQAGDFSQIFVIDKTRTWYNDVHERVCEILQAELGGATSVATIGNSMGGYAALRFASALPHCVRAIAFSPQYAVHPEHMPALEKRWWRQRSGIARHVLGHAMESASGGIDHWIFSGAGHLADIAHLRAFRRLHLPNLTTVCLDRCGHDAAQAMQAAGALAPVLTALLPPARTPYDGIVALLAGRGLSTMPLECAEVRLPGRGKTAVPS